MTEVTLTFATQEQADNAVLALSNGYKVEQWFMGVNSTMKPYCVRVWVPNDDVAQVKEPRQESHAIDCGCHVDLLHGE